VYGRVGESSPLLHLDGRRGKSPYAHDLDRVNASSLATVCEHPWAPSVIEEAPFLKVFE